MKRQKEMIYNGELTGTAYEPFEDANVTDLGALGFGVSPIQQMWQIDPGAEAINPDDTVAQMADMAESE